MGDEHRSRGPRGGVTVTGSGSVEVDPDVAVASLGAEARSADAERALVLAGQCIDRMCTVLREAGVDDRAMQTTQSSTWTDGSALGSSRVVARLGLRVTLTDVASAGAVVGAAVGAGGESARMDGITFGVSDPAQAESRAREVAWADAVARGDDWARLSGRRLGEVQWIQEGGAELSPAFRPRGGVSAVMSVPVESGVVEVAASVTIRWTWADDEVPPGADRT